MNSPGWRWFALVMAVALTARVTAAYLWQSRLQTPGESFVFGDSTSYWSLGQSIAGGEPYKFGADGARVFRAPGYPCLLAPLFAVFGHDTPVLYGRLQNALLGTLAVAGVWYLARELFDQRTALIAAAVAAIYPGAVAMSAFVLSEAPFSALMMLQLILWTLAWKAIGATRMATLAVGGGIVAGAATLVRPSWLLFTPLAVMLGIVIGSPRRRHLGIGAVMLGAMVLVMTPWWIRNAQVTGHFVPTTLQVGASLWDGLNQQATGASDLALVPRCSDLALASELPVKEDQWEYALDRHCRTSALDWAAGHPLSVLKLAAVKIVRIWNVWPNEPCFRSWPMRVVVLSSYMPVMALAVFGAARTIRRGWPYILCWLPALYFTGLHVIFVGSIRYRQPAMLGLIVLAAGALKGSAKGNGARIKDP